MLTLASFVHRLFSSFKEKIKRTKWKKVYLSHQHLNNPFKIRLLDPLLSSPSSSPQLPHSTFRRAARVLSWLADLSATWKTKRPYFVKMDIFHIILVPSFLHLHCSKKANMSLSLRQVSFPLQVHRRAAEHPLFRYFLIVHQRIPFCKSWSILFILQLYVKKQRLFLPHERVCFSN